MSASSQNAHNVVYSFTAWRVWFRNYYVAHAMISLHFREPHLAEPISDIFTFHEPLNAMFTFNSSTQCRLYISGSHSPPTYSLDPSTTRNWSTWSSIRSMLALKDRALCWHDSQQRAGRETEGCDWGRWSEIASLVTEPGVCIYCYLMGFYCQDIAL